MTIDATFDAISASMPDGVAPEAIRIAYAEVSGALIALRRLEASLESTRVSEFRSLANDVHEARATIERLASEAMMAVAK